MPREPAEIFVRGGGGGGGGKPKQGPHHGVKSSKKAPTWWNMAPHNEKNAAKKPLYEEKVAKRPPI